MSGRAIEAVERYRHEPAPLLAILHAIQDQLGWLPESELSTVAEALRIPHGDLFGVVTFYSDGMAIGTGSVSTSAGVSSAIFATNAMSAAVHTISAVTGMLLGTRSHLLSALGGPRR